MQSTEGMTALMSLIVTSLHNWNKSQRQMEIAGRPFTVKLCSIYLFFFQTQVSSSVTDGMVLS